MPRTPSRLEQGFRSPTDPGLLLRLHAQGQLLAPAGLRRRTKKAPSPHCSPKVEALQDLLEASFQGWSSL